MLFNELFTNYVQTFGFIEQVMMDIMAAGCMTVGMEIITHLRNTMVVVASVEIHSRHLAFMDGKCESYI